jgi:plastocyanin
MHRRRLAALAAAVLLGGTLAAGCGGDGSASAGSGSGTAGDSDGPGLSSSVGDADPTAGGDVPDDVVKVEGTEAAVTALDNSFRVESIEVAPGTTVTWDNKGRNEHNVLPVKGSRWGVEVDAFQPGDTYRRTFDTPGVYHYYCSIHGTTDSGMIGTVVVADD